MIASDVFYDSRVEKYFCITLSGLLAESFIKVSIQAIEIVFRCFYWHNFPHKFLNAREEKIELGS